MIEVLSSKLSGIGAAWFWGAGAVSALLLGVAMAAFHRAARVRRASSDRARGLVIAGGLAALGALAVLIGLYLKATAAVYGEA